MNRATTVIITALLTSACFADVGPVEGDSASTGTDSDTGGTEGSGTDTGASTSTGGSTGSTGGVSTTVTGSGSTTGPPGSTGGSTSGSTGGSTSGTGASTGGSTGGGEPLFPDLYEPCESHPECMSGVCVESFGPTQQDVTYGFCSVECDPLAANPCLGAESPFEGWTAECVWHPDDDKTYCGIQSNVGCPPGWRNQSQCVVETPPHPAGCYGACFEEV